jgi:hypothetical protein
MSLRRILEEYRQGRLSLDEAEKRVRLYQISEISGWGKIDTHRQNRTGIPEAVFCEGKTDEEICSLIAAFVEETGRCIATRLAAGRIEGLKGKLKGEWKVKEYPKAGILVVTREDFSHPSTGGRVAVLCAGTSDVPRAEEARIIAGEMGCRVLSFYDVGVAGIHRLIPALQAVIEEDVDAVIVAAGMEGALPSVVGGLVDVPVIGLPISSGYGIGGKGEAALTSILQSCSAGVLAVNIDNGFGAGVAASLIANRVAKFRDRLP